MNKSTNETVITHIDDPGLFYYGESREALNEIGGNAFGQKPEQFGAQVAERCEKAAFGQAFYHRDELVGFGLYNLIRGNLWRHHPVC